jgi:hypothetical protein
MLASTSNESACIEVMTVLAKCQLLVIKLVVEALRMSTIVCVQWSRSKGKVLVEVLRVPIEAVRVLCRRSLQSLKCEDERGCVKKYKVPRICAQIWAQQ